MSEPPNKKRKFSNLSVYIGGQETVLQENKKGQSLTQSASSSSTPSRSSSTSKTSDIDTALSDSVIQSYLSKVQNSQLHIRVYRKASGILILPLLNRKLVISVQLLSFVLHRLFWI
jgi:hypothetical protein